MLKVQSLACQRGGRDVFRKVSFDLKAGDVLFVTGTNGSGKSSLLRMLAGFLSIHSGAILWQDKDMSDDRVSYQRNIHYIGHLDAIKQELTVHEMLDYWRTLQGLTSVPAYHRHDPFGIMSLYDKPVRYLSAGQKRRLTLSRLLCSDSLLWLLDEPTTALDHHGQKILSDCINEHRAKGGMAILATHYDLDLEGALRFDMNGQRP